MSDHQFLVTVTVENWADNDAGVTEQDYASAALGVVSLPDARHLEGFADLDAEADVTGIQAM
jgi:hypothetical protein